MTFNPIVSSCKHFTDIPGLTKADRDDIQIDCNYFESILNTINMTKHSGGKIVQECRFSFAFVR